MGSVKSEPLDVLDGEVIYMVPDHFDDLAISILTLKAEQLGAATTDRNDATIVIVNENSTRWDHEAKETLLSAYDLGREPLILPYHWLSVCHRHRTRVTIEDLPVDIPYMVQPLTDHYPLKVWVSKNVERDTGEDANQAFANVVAQLESVGALAVIKRAHADVLIVDMSSNFYKTVKKEKEDSQRTWQKLAQRDWVDYCLNNGTLQLATQRDEDSAAGSESGGDGAMEVDHHRDEVDSMMDDDSPVRTGPGRPTGRPRVEYTPEDDDFLCRYLAYHNPGGSWHSRKTYQALVSDQLGYPLAARHTSQSWHERFKKNSAAFARRVARFINENVDRSLKTAAERSAAAAKQAEREAGEQRRTQAESNSESGLAANTLRQSGNDRTTGTEPAIQPTAPKRTLVALDSRSPTPEPPARNVDPKGKHREVESEAEPSRTVTETGLAASHGAEATPHNQTGDVGRSDQAAADVTADSGTAAANDDGQVTTEALPKKRKRQSIVDLPTKPASALLNNSTARYETPSVGDGERQHTGSTPLRQEIERSNERRRREQHRKAHGHGPSSRRLSKRASSPDKVYAFVNLPPPRPVIPQVQKTLVQETSSEPPRHRTPPRELTPAEREQSVLAGSRIVQDIAAQYRLKVAALGKKFGVGIKEISAATNEVKRRNGGKSAVDWGMLEMVLKEQYGR